MKNLSSWAAALLVAMFAASETQAQYNQFYSAPLCAAYRQSYDENVIWPYQFIPAARRGISSANATMINNGWRRQNLLGDYHFDSHTNELTDAGKLKVKWVLTQAPAQRRNVFVQRAADQSQTAARVAAVHRLSATMSPAVGPVDVNDTHIVAEGHPAGVVDNVFVGFQTNQPPPVLPPNTGSSVSE